jgi:hypothetical protein
LVKPQTEQVPVLAVSSISVSLWSIRVIHRAGYAHQISAVGTGSVEVPPSNVVIFKGCQDVEHSAATGTGVDGA